uniref:Polyprotein n=1 Tax=Steinernema glaseri TaxID=37863 RepID=A0A1I7ZEE7_9BILA
METYISGSIDGTDSSKIDSDFQVKQPSGPSPVTVTPVGEAKCRQLSSIDILKRLLAHGTMQKYLEDLLLLKDMFGFTPFMLAVNHRAYTAAAVIFNTLQTLYGAKNKAKSNYFSSFTDLVFPQGTGTRVDDSPLFMLCYNDTCSFTWTGEEHINQDIFECRTCGLVGSLCCCTECA